MIDAANRRTAAIGPRPRWRDGCANGSTRRRGTREEFDLGSALLHFTGGHLPPTKTRRSNRNRNGVLAGTIRIHGSSSCQGLQHSWKGFQRLAAPQRTRPGAKPPLNSSPSSSSRACSRREPPPWSSKFPRAAPPPPLRVARYRGRRAAQAKSTTEYGVIVITSSSVL